MKLLVIEDSEDIVQNVLDYFGLKGHSVDFARDGVTGLDKASSQSYDAIVLDVMLPGKTGFEVCRELRIGHSSRVPIVLLTAKDTLESKLAGFEHGADDYLVKPFALSELEARLIALHRRALGDTGVGVLKVGDLTFNTQTLEVKRGDKVLELNPTTRNILRILMSDAPNIVSRAKLETELWGENPPDSDSLRTHMYQLRNALDKPFKKNLLKTVPRAGYRLVVDD